MKSKKLLSLLVGIGLLFTGTAFATAYLPFQGGTGTSTAPTSGQVLIGNASGTYNPTYLTSGTNITIATSSGSLTINSSASGGGVATTTINGAQCPIFTFSVVGTTSVSSYTTSSCTIFFNELRYSSGTDINVATNGIINFVNTPGFISTSTGLTVANFSSANISQWTNNVPYLSTSTGLTTANFATTSISQWVNDSRYVTSTGLTSAVQSVTSSAQIIPSVTSGTNVSFSFATTSISQFNNDSHYVTSTSGGSVAGTSTNVQYNDGGNFAATSSFIFTSSTQKLSLNAQSSSILIGSQFASTTAVFNTFGATSTYVVPTGTTALIVSAKGGSGGCTGGAGETDGGGGTMNGTISVSAGQTIYIYVAKACGGGAASGGWGIGGDMSWISRSPNYTSSTVLLVAAGGGGGSSGSAGGVGGGPTAGTGEGGNVGSKATGQGGSGTAANGGGGGNGFNPGDGGTGTTGGGGGSSAASSTVTNTSTVIGTSVVNGTVSGTVMFYGLSATPSSTNYALAIGGHILTGGPSPSASCGSVLGNDTSGAITINSPTTVCALTFASAFPSNAICTPTLSINATAFVSSTSPTAITFGLSTSTAGSMLYYNHCNSY